MTNLAIALAVVVSATAPRALDVAYGDSMRRVDALRAQAKYDEAESELRALIDRFRAGGLVDSNDALWKRTEDVLRDIVELETLAQQAESDPAAAHRYLARLVNPAKPNAHTAEVAHALLVVAKHDEKVRALLDAAFPARVVVVARVAGAEPNVFAWPLENALVDMSLGALPLAHENGAGASELRVHIEVFDNERKNSILEGTAMRSYAAQMTAELVGADGVAIARSATTTSLLGINAGYAARSGSERAAQVLYAALVDDIAKRCALE